MKSVACCALQPDQVDAVIRLDQHCFGGIWTKAGYQREIDSPNSDLWVLVASGSAATSALPPNQVDPIEPSSSPLLGVGCSWAIVDEAHITLLGIAPQYRQQGLGRWLLLQLLEAARDRNLQRATLEVRASNLSALSLYESLGFRVAGCRHQYYEDGEDALILWRSGLQNDMFGRVLHGWQRSAQQRLTQNGWQPIAPWFAASSRACSLNVH